MEKPTIYITAAQNKRHFGNKLNTKTKGFTEVKRVVRDIVEHEDYGVLRGVAYINHKLVPVVSTECDPTFFSIDA